MYMTGCNNYSNSSLKGKPCKRLVSIVIPTLNEAYGIKKTIERIPIDELKDMGYDCEIIVVDGGSTDGTIEIAKSLGAKVIMEHRRGYGRAYKTGLSHVKGDIIITLDGDGSYPSEYIPKLIRILEMTGADFITVNRFRFMGEHAMGTLRRIGNFILSLITRLLFHIEIKDTQSGMWVFRKYVLKKIMPRSNGMPFSEEIKIRAFLNVGKCLEVAGPYYKRFGESKLNALRDGIENLIYLLRLFIQIRKQ